MITYLCPLGAEELAKQELVALGAQTVRLGRAQLHVSDEPGADEAGIGGLKTALTACLHARLVSRPLLSLAQFEATDARALYDGVRTIDWPSFIDPVKTLSVRCARGEGSLRHGPYVAQVVKDAIVDVVRERHGRRPDVDRRSPDATIVIALLRGQAHVSFDLAGESLHRRGIRLAGGLAPLSESLAALMLSRAGWPAIAARGGPFVDPMCGSGTLLIEAAGMARRLPANAMREHFGADGLACLPQALWRTLRHEARALYKERRASPAPTPLFGSDSDVSQLRRAEEVLEATGFADDVVLRRGAVSELVRPPQGPPGLIATNAPYGERLEATRAALLGLYDELGTAIRRYPGYHASVLCGDEELGYALRLRGVRKTTMLNGGLPCVLLQADVAAPLSAQAVATIRLRLPTSRQQPRGKDKEKPGPSRAPVIGFRDARPAPGDGAEQTATQRPARAALGEALPNQEAPPPDDAMRTVGARTAPLPHGADDFVHRLQKNRRRIERRALREGWGAYRIYDADIPTYSAAIDLYIDEAGERWAYLQEYKAPKQIPIARAQARMRAMVLAAPNALEVDASRFIVTVRSRQREKDAAHRYGAKQARPRFFTVNENGMRFVVSLEAYVDTGLFLDHRSLRAHLSRHARGAHFLNLFSYTSTVSVAAAFGGALSTTSVDKSTTYLDWSARNFSANDMTELSNKLVKADVMQWLHYAQQLRHLRSFYDIAYLGPPSFSQSHSDPASFDVNEDHARCIELTMALLSPTGELWFSTHRRLFALDARVTETYSCEEKTEALRTEDFRGQKPHRIWRISHRAGGE